MTFYSAVEQWRTLVQEVLAALSQIEPEPSRIFAALGLTRPMQEDLALAIIQKESSGSPDITGDRGCSLGLMQINYCVHSGESEFLQYPLYQPASGEYVLSPVQDREDLYLPDVNVGVGVRHLISLLNSFRSVNLAVIAYNGGPGTAAEWVAHPDTLPVNFTYLTTVLSFLQVPLDYFERLLADTEKKTLLGVLLLGGGVFLLGWYVTHHTTARENETLVDGVD